MGEGEPDLNHNTALSPVEGRLYGTVSASWVRQAHHEGLAQAIAARD